MKRILIVDDTNYVRRYLREMIEELGHKVIGEAKNGKEAVKMVEELSPDIVIMDIVMPGKNGIDAMKEMKEKKPSLHIILMSAMGQEKLIMDAINAGAKTFIIKPFRKENILSAIEKAG